MITIKFAWDIWCIGAFWYSNEYRTRLNIFPLPFVVITIEKSNLEYEERMDKVIEMIRGENK